MKKIVFVLTYLLVSLCMLTTSASDITREYEVEVTENDVFALIFTVIKPNESNINFETLSSENVGEALFNVESQEFYLPNPGVYKFNLRIKENDPYGLYHIRTTKVYESGKNSVSQYYTTYKATQQEIADVASEFHSLPAEDIVAKLNEYTTVKELMYIPELEKINTLPDFGNYYVAVRNENYPNEYADGLEDLSDNTWLATFAAVLDTGNETDIKEYLAVYVENDTVLNGYKFESRPQDAAQMQQNFVNTYLAHRTNENKYSLNALIADCRISLGYTIFNKGTILEKSKAIEEYSAEFGLDLNEASNKGVSLLETANFMNGEYNTVNDVRNDYITAVSKAYSKKNQQRPAVGGGGSPRPVNPTVSAPDISLSGQKVETKPEAIPAVNTFKETTFDDIADAEWAETEINKLKELGIISGYYNKFNPNNNITRAEFMKMLVLLLDIKLEGNYYKFTDCTEDDWYFPYVMAGYNAGITKGLTEDFFGADVQITREDMAVMVFRALENKYISLDYVTDAEFKDDDSISDYAVKPFKELAKAGIVKGYDDGCAKPQQLLTRAETAVVLCRFLDKLPASN